MKAQRDMKKLTEIRCNNCAQNDFEKLPDGNIKCNYCGSVYGVEPLPINTARKGKERAEYLSAFTHLLYNAGELSIHYVPSFADAVRYGIIENKIKI